MGWTKRVGLFLFVNLLVLFTISFVLRIFNVHPYISDLGIDYYALMIFCLIWGMGGALISLLLSRIMAKWMMGVHLVDVDTRDPMLKELIDVVYRLAEKASLSTMPEVGIYHSSEVNAFATGPTRSRALVAVSSGLLERMNRDEVEGVLAHEISHIANGDMVTMTLIQGIVNAFVLFLARVVAFFILRGNRQRGSGGLSSFTYYITVFFLELVLMVLGSLVVFWFSRFREYRADAGGALLVGRNKMLLALERLKKTSEIPDSKSSREIFQTFKISGKRSRFLALFSTHPSIEERVKRL